MRYLQQAPTEDDYGGTQVDRVFLNESDVRLYVTTEIMANFKNTRRISKKTGRTI
jgi:hypothetical protein